eukprot:g20981.t1
MVGYGGGVATGAGGVRGFQGFEGNAPGLGLRGGGGASMSMQGRGGYYGVGNSLGGDAGGWAGGGGASWTYQVSNRKSSKGGFARRHADQINPVNDDDVCRRLLARLGIADKTDDFTMNVKVYVVNLIKRYLSDFSKAPTPFLKVSARDATGDLDRRGEENGACQRRRRGPDFGNGTQTMASLLSPAHYESFLKSSQFMCIYDRGENRCVELNQCMRDRLQGSLADDISVVVQSEAETYITVSGIPCKLRMVLDLDGDLCIMEMFPAHTKKWMQSSDLIQLTDLASDGVWEWFPSVNFEYMSKRFWSILGYDQHDMDETPLAWMDHLNPDDKDAMLKMYEAHLKSRGESPYHGHVRYSHKEGHEVVVLCRGSIVDWLPDGTPWKMLGTHTDVTSIVKKDAIEAKSIFIARMSHEIRSPICTILNECELLGMNSRTRVIQDTCNQLISITDDILNLGSSKGSDLKLVPQEVDIYALLNKSSTI